MRKFKQNKLWRDKSIELMEMKGSRINWRRLSDEEYKLNIKEKLNEEVKEVISAQSKEEIIEELADILEVVEAICQAYNISQDSIWQKKSQKIEHRGSFAGRKFVESAEHPRGSFGEKYCLADPKKYPEIL